jgi:hypothetical protein
MSKQNSLSTADIALPFACIVVVSTLFTAGLWPFNPFPKNQVTWLASGKGLQFGDHGVVFSRWPVERTRLKRDSFCTLAIRLQPEAVFRGASGTLLEFYASESPSQFRLMQWRDFLLMRRDYRDAQNHLKTREVDVEHAFLTHEPVWFTITSSPDGSVVYRNGVRVAGTTRMGLSCADFAGQLVLGDSAITDNAWPGNILDLAIYDRELSSQEIASKYVSWNENKTVHEVGVDQRVDLYVDQHIVAQYPFNEGSGQNVRGQPVGAPDLYIPEIFKVPHKKMLMWPWEEGRDKVTVRDLSINIFGFVPFGFVFIAYLTWNRNARHATIVTILCGAAISLTIEILQEYIPGRDSGILDIITNTVGTSLGALLFRWAPMQYLTRKTLDFLRSGEQISEN